MSINVNDKNLGHATAYAYYKAGGGTMTEAEFTEFMADFGTASQTAVEAAQAALASKNAAQTAATTATNKATEATTAATTATTKAGEASTSASTATSAKDTAVSAARTATTKATEATTAAATATSAATTATTAKDDAVSAKTAAQTAQTGAETAAASVQSSAEQIATNAEDISQLKSEITDKSDTADMLKAFPADTASGSVASFADGANVPVKSLIINIDPVQSGSGDPSPDNVRPISGWSEVNVQRTGINIFDGEWEVGLISATTGQNTDDNNYCRTKNYLPVVPNSEVYCIPENKTLYFREYDANKNFIRYAQINSNNRLLVILPDTFFVRFCWDGNTYDGDISINYPSSDHSYHEPQLSTSINISLGQTVYGGKIDVTKGELTVDSAMVDLGTLNWFLAGSGRLNSIIVDQKNVPVSVAGNAKCTAYKVVSNNDVASTNNGIAVGINNYTIQVNDSRYNGGDPNAFKTAVSGVMLCYELATPLTVQLTPHEVTALLGSNNVWADSGDSEVTYRADPTLYIQRLTEPDADMIADANITSGQYFMVGNTLYKATANIASGATISPNVNCTRKSLSEALNELNV